MSARDRELLTDRHFPESIAFASVLPPATRWVDLGSGGGLPGVVMAICRPEVELHLIESRKKKADFLAAICTELGLEQVTVHHARAEDTPVRGPLVTARAVAPFKRLLGYAHAVTLPGAELWAIKGESWEAELAEATNRAGFRVVDTPSEVTARVSVHEMAPGVALDRAALPRIVRLRRGST